MKKYIESYESFFENMNKEMYDKVLNARGKSIMEEETTYWTEEFIINETENASSVSKWYEDIMNENDSESSGLFYDLFENKDDLFLISPFSIVSKYYDDNNVKEFNNQLLEISNLLFEKEDTTIETLLDKINEFKNTKWEFDKNIKTYLPKKGHISANEINFDILIFKYMIGALESIEAEYYGRMFNDKEHNTDAYLDIMSDLFNFIKDIFNNLINELIELTKKYVSKNVFPISVKKAKAKRIAEASLAELETETGKLKMNSREYQDLLSVKSNESSLVFTEYFEVLYGKAIVLVKLTSNEYYQKLIDKFNYTLTKMYGEKENRNNQYHINNYLEEINMILDQPINLSNYITDLSDDIIKNELIYQRDVIKRILTMSNLEEVAVSFMKNIYDSINEVLSK